MKKLILALATVCAIGAQAATCLKSGYTAADLTAAEVTYRQQADQIMAERDAAMYNTTGETAEEKNAQVYAIVQKAEADLDAAYQAYLTAYASMTYTCN